MKVSINGTGSGTVTSGSAIACPPDCIAGFPNPSSPIVLASPDPGSLFTGFGGACTGTGPCVITLNGADATLTATFDALLLDPGPLPAGAVGLPCHAAAITSSNGTTPFTFTLVSGVLPPGLTLADNGDLTGAPTQGGMFTFAVQGTDSSGAVGTRTYAIAITCPSIGITPAGPPPARLGQPFSLRVSTSPVDDAVIAIGGTLPPGLTVNGTTLSGTPAALGRFDVIATATSATSACSATHTYAVRVMRPPSFVAGGGSGAIVKVFDSLGTATRGFIATDDPPSPAAFGRAG